MWLDRTVGGAEMVQATNLFVVAGKERVKVLSSIDLVLRKHGSVCSAASPDRRRRCRRCQRHRLRPTLG